MERKMIPKIIHYCWFGKGEMPELAKKCISSWKKYLPEYKFVLWNEYNFNLEQYPYAKEAYHRKKFAFVTDVVRMYALYNYGGVYMDTDVEILKPLDDFLNNQAFSGFESENFFPTGLMAAEKGSLWAKENLDWYDGKHFIKEDGSEDMTTNVIIIMNNMKKYNVKLDNSFQVFENYFTLYPKDYFCPLDHKTRNLLLTENTVSIHHFMGSWVDKQHSISFIGKIWLKLHLPNTNIRKKIRHYLSKEHF